MNHRVIVPELLDELDASSPLAIGSRNDLQRLNSIMGTAGILARAFDQYRPRVANDKLPLRVIELGSGDGSLLLKFAKLTQNNGTSADASLVDMRPIVTRKTLQQFDELGWKAQNIAADVFAFLEASSSDPCDVILTNLFLHHFKNEQLKTLFQLAAQKTSLFIACEPKRSFFSKLTAQNLWALGCNSVTRNDAVISVEAGFNKSELSQLWLNKEGWTLHESSAGLFNHCFVASRNA